jgi:hypothetical protein
MKNLLHSSSLKKRRAVSQIVGSLLILGIVTSVGSVLLFNGMKQINAFSYDLSFHDKVKNESFREDLLFEHVRFDPSTNNIEISLANIGTVESTITSLSIIQLDTQDLLVNRVDLNDSIQIEDSTQLIVAATLPVLTPTWSDYVTAYPDSEYKISMSTSKGNFFATVAIPFNT